MKPLLSAWDNTLHWLLVADRVTSPLCFPFTLNETVAITGAWALVLTGAGLVAAELELWCDVVLLVLAVVRFEDDWSWLGMVVPVGTMAAAFIG